MKIRITLMLALTMFLGACADNAIDTTGGIPATITGVEFRYLESYPVQVRAVVTGDLPTPCHELDTNVADLAYGRVVATVLAIPPATDVICAQVRTASHPRLGDAAVEPFEVTLDLGSFENGAYVLDLNGTEYLFSI